MPAGASWPMLDPEHHFVAPQKGGRPRWIVVGEDGIALSDDLLHSEPSRECFDRGLLVFRRAAAAEAEGRNSRSLDFAEGHGVACRPWDTLLHDLL